MTLPTHSNYWNTKVVLKVIVTALVSVLLSSCLIKGDSSTEAGDQLILNAAPQNGYVFLTWSKHQDAHERAYSLYWRPVGDNNQWNKIIVYGSEHYAVTDLLNGTEYEFYVTVSEVEGVHSHIVKQTPKLKENCSFPGEGMFCTQQAARNWGTVIGIDPSTLRCRGEPLKTLDLNMPNCYYSTVDGRFKIHLLRAIDMSFDPPPHREPQLIRQVAIRTIWPDSNPFNHPEQFEVEILDTEPVHIGSVTQLSKAHSFEIKYHPNLSSRITWFVPVNPTKGYAIYHEGHKGSGANIGSETIDWLLERGWVVINIDMPLEGANTVDRSESLRNHDDFDRLDNGIQSPIGLFLFPVKVVVDMIYDYDKSGDGENGVNLMMIGRSGGGWTTILYSALDPRIDVAVSIAGAEPISQRLSRVAEASIDDLAGDYEQNIPHIFDVVTYPDFMKAAGSKGALYIYNKNDSCCFRLKADDDFVKYLNSEATNLEKRLTVWIDENNDEHSISKRGYEVLEEFLMAVLQSNHAIDEQ